MGIPSSLPLACGSALVEGELCKVNQCQNGGTCITGADSSPFFCVCADGFTGIACNETETGPCHPNPCQNNGVCQIVPGRGDVFTEYVCQCPSGYEGKHCQNKSSSFSALDMDECASQPCQNGGICLDLERDYSCKCAPLYLGKTCSIRSPGSPDLLLLLCIFAVTSTA
uniref:Uncharacterized protein n=1 Tax=Sphaerodactylus townsendi TaxID=933632 RepID=A0ACB8E5Q2_9SAUR